MSYFDLDFEPDPFDPYYEEWLKERRSREEAQKRGTNVELPIKKEVTVECTSTAAMPRCFESSDKRSKKKHRDLHKARKAIHLQWYEAQQEDPKLAALAWKLAKAKYEQLEQEAEQRKQEAVAKRRD